MIDKLPMKYEHHPQAAPLHFTFNISGGVPVNIMEVVRFPREGTPENQKALEVGFYNIGV